MAESVAIRPEDHLPVYSRVSWGAIFGGAVLGLAMYFLFSLLGVAVGLSVSNDATTDQLTGAAIWMIVSTLLALFIAGCVCSQLTAGESRVESLIHGTIVWDVVFSMLLWLMASGVRVGFNAMVGRSHLTPLGVPSEDWQAAARGAGVPQAQIDAWNRNLGRAGEGQVRERDAQVTSGMTQAAWYSVLGIFLSLLAAAGGALAGAGPHFHLARYYRTHTYVHRPTTG